MISEDLIQKSGTIRFSMFGICDTDRAFPALETKTNTNFIPPPFCFVSPGRKDGAFFRSAVIFCIFR